MADSKPVDYHVLYLYYLIGLRLIVAPDKIHKNIHKRKLINLYIRHIIRSTPSDTIFSLKNAIGFQNVVSYSC